MVYMLCGIVLYPYLLLALSGRNKYKRAVRVKKVWANAICFFTMMRVEILDKTHFPEKGPYIVCANHMSYLDIILMYKLIPIDFAFLAKAEVLKYPIINLFFKRRIDIYVHRGNRRKSAISIRKANEALENGRSLAIFPEGKIGWHPPKLERFKNGAFTLALNNSVPIVPVTFLNNYKLFSDPTDTLGSARPGVAKIIIHPPIMVTDASELVSLRNQTHQIIKEALENGY